MKRTTVFLKPSQRQRLAQRSQETGAPIAAIIRLALDHYLQPAKPAPGPQRKTKAERGTE